MIRKVTAITTALVVSASFAPLASAGTKKPPPRAERTEEVDYSCPCGTRVGMDTKGLMLFGFGGVSFETEPTDRYVTIEIVDVAGGPVSAAIKQDTDDGNTVYEGSQDVCGKTGEPVKIMPGAAIDIYLYLGTCADGQTRSLPARGTVTATFSNLP